MTRRKKCTLSAYWVKWRRRRYQSLAAQGLSYDLAWDVAAAEAKYRHSVGKIIGREAAKDAELVSLGERFVLLGSLARVTDSQVEAIEAMNNRAMPKTA